MQQFKPAERDFFESVPFVTAARSLQPLDDGLQKLRRGSKHVGTNPFRARLAVVRRRVKGDCSLRGLRGGSFGDSDVRYEASGFRVSTRPP